MDIVFTQGRGFDEQFAKGAIKELLEAVDFPQTEMQVVHTDIHRGNLLLGIKDKTLFNKIEEAEFSNPVPRKTLSDRTIYFSRLMKPKVGPLLLSDFGETRPGPGANTGDIMPIMYRALETQLCIPWSYAVDIRRAGLTAWHLLQGKTSFSARKEDRGYSDGVHFSGLISALGPPPRDLLSRNPRNRERASEY